MKDNFTIYIHRNKINNKVYIGQTSQDVNKRWNNGEGYKTSPKFYKAIKKYGWDNFEHIILYNNLSLEEANKMEIELIKKYNSTNDKYGYNITQGGKNFHHSEETKKKISEANKISLKGNKWSDEQKRKMSEKMMGENNPFFGKTHSEETKKLISQHRKGKCKGSEHPLFGKHHDQKTLNKISQNRKSKGGKKVLCINTGEIFETMMDAARWCGLTNSSSIGQVCNNTGKQKTAGKHPITKEKLKWKFIEEKDK